MMLVLQQLSKRLAGHLIVDQVSFSARGGEVTGFLGPNGSGKSTTLRMLAGLIEKTSGTILFRGRPIDDDLIAWKQRLGYMPEELHLYSHLTGLEYLLLIAQLRELPSEPAVTRIDGLLQLLALDEHRDIQMSAYSKGMRQKILLAASVLHNPDVLLLDEPFSGLDVASSLILRSFLEALAARGKVVIFSSHELDTVERVASRVVIVHHGKVVADDSIERLRHLMEQPTLESLFAHLTVEQDPVATAHSMVELVCT